MTSVQFICGQLDGARTVCTICGWGVETFHETSVRFICVQLDGARTVSTLCAVLSVAEALVALREIKQITTNQPEYSIRMV